MHETTAPLVADLFSLLLTSPHLNTGYLLLFHSLSKFQVEKRRYELSVSHCSVTFLILIFVEEISEL